VETTGTGSGSIFFTCLPFSPRKMRTAISIPFVRRFRRTPSASCPIQSLISPHFGHRPNGSLKLTGSPFAKSYRLSPPASPIGSSCVRETGRRFCVRPSELTLNR
jgi:hypothetical protein